MLDIEHFGCGVLPMDFRSALREQIRSGFCTALNDDARWSEFFSSRTNIPFPSASPGLYTLFCNRPLRPNPVNPPPFQGGQCPVLYDVFFDSKVADIDGQQFPPSGELYGGRYQGRLGGVRFSPDGTTFQLLTQADTNPTWFNIAVAGSPWDQSSTRITRVQRVDGQPDNCGSLPGTEPPIPPDYNFFEGDVTYVDDNDVSITVPTVFEFLSPTINVRGELNVPVSVRFNDPLLNVPINIRATINLSTGDTIYNDPKISPPNGNPNNPKDAVKTEPLPEEGDGDGDLEDPQEDTPDDSIRIIRGAVVVVTSDTGDSPATTIFRDRIPDLQLPDVGQVSFLIRVGDDVVWSSFKRVQFTREFVTCDWDLGAVDVHFEPRPGVTGIAIPVYRTSDAGVTAE